MVKKKYFQRDRYKGSKGLKMDSTSQTIQDDSMSVKDMLERHVQGLLDPTNYNDAQYDDESVDHDTEIGDRSQKTELELLEYAEEHGMTKQEVEQFISNSEPYIPETSEEVPDEPVMASEEQEASE